MPLFSTYKSSRLASGYSKWHLVHRSIGEHFAGRPWAHGAFWLPFSSMPVFMTWLMLFYFGQRWYQWDQWFKDELEATVLKRWGEDPAVVAKRLSPEDQARARGWAQVETAYSVFATPKIKFAQAGSGMAGPHGTTF
jgi:hypothetical protein